MKKMLILTILAIFVVGSAGCRNRARNWWYRGAICTPPVVTTCTPDYCVEDCPTDCQPSCDDSGAYYSGYSDNTLPAPIQSGGADSGYQGSDSSRPGPDPGNDT
ncbi:MAG: hypothetical protein JW829_12245 [Pirellulales bacterium]|nr:hypothetical protein [Pirellulales bacterium]